MPQRKAPPPGYCTATEAMTILGNKMLYKYVERGLIHPTGPNIRRHKYYLISELEQVKAQETAFYNPPQSVRHELQEHTITFSRATPEDMDGVYAVASKLFHETTSADARKPLVDRCPDGNYILKDNGVIVAYIHLQPLKHDRLIAFMQGKIRGWQISAEDLQCFPVDQPIELLIKSTGSYHEKPAIKKFYMERLLIGTAHAIAQLGRQGVHITKLYATSETPTGIEMSLRAKMTSLGPVKGSKGTKRYAFVLDMSTSDLKLVRPYQTAYAMWKAEHAPTSPSPTAPRQEEEAKQKPQVKVVRSLARTDTTENTTLPTPADLPEGTLHIQDFMKRHNIDKGKRRNITNYLDEPGNGLGCERFPKLKRPKETDYYLTPEQQQMFLAWLEQHHPNVLIKS